MRGFCTIATGSMMYSQLAYNLLMSYRKFATKDYPFTVFTEKRNELLDNFDDVKIIEKSNKSFLDKLLIFAQTPYEETIFIDADSLAYGDLSELFDYFSQADDVSCLGEVLEKDSLGGWFRYENTMEYKSKINYSVWMHGGIYYVRKGEKAKRFYQTCLEIIPKYKQIFPYFKYLVEPADEPIVALAMAVHGFKPIYANPDIMAFYRDSKIKDIDIISGKLSYSVSTGTTDKGHLIHWATENTRKAYYTIESKKLKWCIDNPGKSPLWLQNKWWQWSLFLLKISEMLSRKVRSLYVQ